MSCCRLQQAFGVLAATAISFRILCSSMFIRRLSGVHDVQVSLSCVVRSWGVGAINIQNGCVQVLGRTKNGHLECVLATTGIFISDVRRTIFSTLHFVFFSFFSRGRVAEKPLLLVDFTPAAWREYFSKHSISLFPLESYQALLVRHIIMDHGSRRPTGKRSRLRRKSRVVCE